MSPYDSNPGAPDRRPTTAEREALEWVARLDRGLTREEESEFDRWLAGDARHAALFAEFDGTWAFLDRVREVPETCAVFHPSVGATASPPRPPVSESEADGLSAGSARGAPLVASTTAQAGRSTARRWLVAASLAAAAIVVGAYLLLPIARRRGEAAAYSVHVTTDLGELRKVALPDGSVVHLNTDSAVDVDFSSSGRRLRLIRGEAHFTVAKNRAWPFTVSAGGVEVRAVGTVFNVRLRSQAVEVLVTEGKVMLDDEANRRSRDTAADAGTTGAPPPRDGAAEAAALVPPPLANCALAAGEKITIPLIAGSSAVPAAPPISVTVPVAEIEHTLAWQDRRLEFVSVPLADMVTEFNRYNRRKLVIADAALAAQRFGGVFRPDDAAGFVRALEVNFGVVAEQRSDETVLRLAAP